MKQHLTTIVLVIAALGLALWFYRDRDKVSETERRSREGSAFGAWRREDLTKIEIAHEGESIVLARKNKDDAWRMTSPREERVDQNSVERLATTLEFATQVRKVAPGDSLGFERPRATGAITMGTLVFRFSLGGSSPRPEGSGYFKVDDGAPFVASKEVTDALLASSDAYRDRAVVPYLSLDLARFEVIHEGGGFVVQRHDDRSFDVPAVGVLAARHALDKAWGALAEMRAEAFPKDADADRLTVHPTMTIRMKPKDNAKAEAELVVGDACPGHPDDVVVLRKQPTRAAACAPKGAIESLREITPSSLVDLKPFAFRHDEIEELRLEGNGEKPVEIARKGVGFHEREPVDRELPTAEADAASELLVAIERTEATDVQAGHGAPFTAIGKAKVWAGDHDETVEVGALFSNSVQLRRLRDDARLTVSAIAARRLLPRETTLRSLVLLNETRRVTRVGLRCGVEQDFVDNGEGLRLVKPAGYETDGAITQLVDGLTRGKVLEWSADRDDGTFGITPEGCRIVLSYADGNLPSTIHLGKMDAGGLYGSVDGERGVFLAPEAFEAMMRRIYVNRGSLRLEHADRVTVGGRAGDPEAVSGFVAERVFSLGSSDVGPVDVEITMSAPDAGPPRRITCSASDGTMRRCSTPGVKAVFEVKAATVAKLAGPAISDAGGVDAR